MINGYNIQNKLEPQGPLKVSLDLALARVWPDNTNIKQQVKRNWMWNSHIKFHNPVDDPIDGISDGQLWQIARDAWFEMKADFDQYQIGNYRNSLPTAMTVLAYDHEIILASSQKGQLNFLYDYANQSPVTRSLQACQIVWREVSHEDKRHKNNGSCGEPMACQVYYTIHETPLNQRNARIATVLGRVSGADGNVEHEDPCGSDRVSETTCPIPTAAL